MFIYEVPNTTMDGNIWMLWFQKIVYIVFIYTVRKITIISKETKDLLENQYIINGIELLDLVKCVQMILQIAPHPKVKEIDLSYMSILKWKENRQYFYDA